MQGNDHVVLGPNPTEIRTESNQGDIAVGEAVLDASGRKPHF